MVSGKPKHKNVTEKKKHSKPLSQNPNHIPLGKKNKMKTMKKAGKKEVEEKKQSAPDSQSLFLSNAPPSQQLELFLNRFQSANGIRLSSLELQEFKDSCMVELSESPTQDAGNLSEHLKAVFGASCKEVLCDSQLLEGMISAGSPAVLVISTSAIRSLELLRGVQSLTKQCRPAKLFAKHIKVEDQVLLLKSRVNIACGTPSRIKKLIDMDALGLSRLALVMLDMHTDAKGYSLFTLPQVSDEFWNLYRSHFQKLLLPGSLRLCFYGPTSSVELKKFCS